MPVELVRDVAKAGGGVGWGGGLSAWACNRIMVGVTDIHKMTRK